MRQLRCMVREQEGSLQEKGFFTKFSGFIPKHVEEHVEGPSAWFDQQDMEGLLWHTLKTPLGNVAYSPQTHVSWGHSQFDLYAWEHPL